MVACICRRWLVLGMCLASLLLASGNTVHALGPMDTQSLLETAQKNAKAEGKVVLVAFGASWCKWCKAFDAFVEAQSVRQIIADNYVIVKLTVQERAEKKALETPGAQAAMNSWTKPFTALPYYVFLDAEGQKLADSKAMPDGSNFGFPATKQEIEAFLQVLDRTAPRLSKAQREKVAEYLSSSGKP